jgi:hypothetical protein
MSPVVAALLKAPDMGMFVTTFVTVFSGLIPVLNAAGNATSCGNAGAFLQDRFADLMVLPDIWESGSGKECFHAT